MTPHSWAPAALHLSFSQITAKVFFVLSARSCIIVFLFTVTGITLAAGISHAIPALHDTTVTTPPDRTDEADRQIDPDSLQEQPGMIDDPPASDDDQAGVDDRTISGTGETGQTAEGDDPVHFSSSDSLIFSNREERTATLFGNARVGNQMGELTAGEVLLNLDRNLMSAQAGEAADTLSEPVLQRGEDRVRSQKIQYNYKTDKGKFDVARVSLDQGNVTGTQVKRTSPDVIFVDDGIYSTCDLDHPHFYIRADRMKVVGEDEIFFTRARLFILDIPYPLVFPFGFVPSRISRKQSGILEPEFTYQEQQQRGIGLRNLGWFQYFNDNLTGQVDMDIFTSGTYRISTRMNYRRTDQYNGSVQLEFSRDQGLEPTDLDFTRSDQRRLAIDHSQTINPFSSISARINLRTADFYNRNSYDIDDRAEVSTSSRVSYNYSHPEGSFSFNVSSNVNQNFATDATTLTGPDARFSMRRITPFQSSGPGRDESWYESLSIQYNARVQSRYNFRPQDTDIGFFEALLSPSKHEEATGDFRHINAGLRQEASASLQLFSNEFINMNTNVQAREYWYPDSYREEWDPEEQRVVSSMERGFTAGRDFQTSVSANTAIYGISPAGIGRFRSFRHTIEPSLSFSYRPDFSDNFWGFYREVQINEAGDTRQYSKFEGGVVGGPGAGEQRSLGISISNRLEAKEVRRDTTGERSERNVRLIDRLNLSTSYNFAAENFNLADLSATMTSSFFPNLNLNANANFSFYDTDDDGNRIDQYLWEESGRFLRMTRFTFSASTSFSSSSGGRRDGQRTDWHHPRHYDPFDQARFHPIDRAIHEGRVQRIDVPWSFSVNFNYRWQELPGGDSRQNATLNVRNIQFRLTPEWQAGTNIGYDFVEKELTPSNFSITRNLHCWDLSFQWNPFGDTKYFMFRLTVRDSQIQGLLQKLPGLNNLERTSGPINRFPR